MEQLKNRKEYDIRNMKDKEGIIFTEENTGNLERIFFKSARRRENGGRRKIHNEKPEQRQEIAPSLIQKLENAAAKLKLGKAAATDEITLEMNKSMK